MSARAVVCSALLVLLAQPVSGTSIFLGIGHLPDARHVQSVANAVSADGTTVAGQAFDSSGASKAFRWTAETGLVDLGRISASGVSADGSVVVGLGRFSNGSLAFRWSGGGLDSLGDLPGGERRSLAAGVSADGSVVVGRGDVAGNTSEAFRWTPEAGMVGLGDLAGGEFLSTANAVSADGSVVVGESSSASGAQAFVWTDETGMFGLGDLPGGSFHSEAHGISGDGLSIVGSSNSGRGREAFLWTQATGMVGLGAPGQATAASGGGAVVVGWASSEAFIWDADTGMRNLRNVLEDDFGLDLSGWTLTEATGISADGRTIVGYGTNPSGNVEGWLAVLPEPSPVGLVVVGVALVALRLRRDARSGRGEGPGGNRLLRINFPWPWRKSSPIGLQLTRTARSAAPDSRSGPPPGAALRPRISFRSGPW